MPPITKVIVIGLDGLEPSIVERMMTAKELPNLAELRRTGAYARIATTYPAQTPVAWASFATGTNPGGHGIFDFIRRDPRTYLPDLSLTRYEQKNLFLPPRAVNLRRGIPFWDLLGVSGISSVVLRSPCTYPSELVKGRMLSGVGVPDLRGGIGTATFYMEGQVGHAGEAEQLVPVRAEGDTVNTTLIGPRHPKSGVDCTVPISVVIRRAEGRAIVRSEGEPRELALEVGRWSGWLRVKFKLGLLQTVRGIVRFHLVQMSPLKLYASAVNFDPEAPPFPISTPLEYAAELSARLGPYHTAGMPEDHRGLSNERFSEAAYLDQCHGIIGEREQMMRYELDRLTEGFFFCLFDTPDRLQHMFWRFGDDSHPANRGDVTPELRRVIAEHYRLCDRIVGDVMRYAHDRTVVIVLSDHGMNTFRRGVHVNSWLHEQGLLAFKPGTTPEERSADFFRAVDWTRTRAYSVGLGGIYVNLAGREAQGTVRRENAPGLMAEIAGALTNLGDPERSEVAVRSVATREQLYAGPYADESPDLLINFAAGYRASWATTLGGAPPGIFEDNTRKWGGDHIIDPMLVPGVLFMNRPFNTANPTLLDMAPTILDAWGLAKGRDMEGRSLLS